MSREEPSMTTPLNPFSFAESDRSPPQHENCSWPPLSITIMSPVFAASIGAVPKCWVGCCNPAGLSFIVTARPAMRGHSQSGRTPQVAPFKPKLSSASETAQVSSLTNRSTIGSRAITEFGRTLRSAPLCDLRYLFAYIQYANAMPQPVAAGDRYVVTYSKYFNSRSSIAPASATQLRISEVPPRNRSRGNLKSVSDFLFFDPSMVIASISSSITTWLNPPDAMIATFWSLFHDSIAFRTARPKA